MNNKEFTAELAKRMNCSPKEVANMIQVFCSEMQGHLENEDIVSLPSFGIFEVKKKLERVVVSPSTKQRMLVPPKMVINFKASTAVKDLLKNKKK